MEKMSLEQLRETLPEVQTAPEDPSKGIEAAAAAAADQQARRERAWELRGCIMRQLQQGQPPQIVLYNALEAMDRASHPPPRFRLCGSGAGFFHVRHGHGGG